MILRAVWGWACLFISNGKGIMLEFVLEVDSVEALFKWGPLTCLAITENILGHRTCLLSQDVSCCQRTGYVM